jgi:hypothetical protein
MKLQTLFALCATLCFTTPAQADPKAVDEIIELLRSAEASPKPLPILEKAKAELKEYQPKPAVAAGVRKKGAIRAEAADRKRDAMERLNQAIEEAKAGRDPKSKITAAISNVRHMGAMRD